MPYRVRTERRPTSLELDGTVYVLEDDTARAEVWPALGFNCYRWRVVRAGVPFELLYAAPKLFDEDAPTRSGLPILFPFPNRIRDGRFTWDGRDYQLPPNDPSGKNAIHGFACRRPWRVVDHGADERGAWITGTFAGARTSADGVILWPAEHALRVTYRLSAESLRVEALVDNPDHVPLPFGLGYHPYFRVPFREGVRPADYSVDVPASSVWELDDLLPTGKRLPVEGPRDLRLSTPFERLRVDDVLTDLQDVPSGSEGLIERGFVQEEALAVRLLCSADFRELVAFTPPHRQAVCLEPYTCVTDAINLQQRGIDAGLRVLPPGAQWTGVVECRLVD